MDGNQSDEANLHIASRWCAARGSSWRLVDTAGRGGTAPVFTVDTGDRQLALKLYDEAFSNGPVGEESERRLAPQVALGLHDCSSLIRVHDAGRFESRLFVLMDKAPGRELEKSLREVPRPAIRLIVDKIARAAIYLRRHGLCHRDIKSANIFVADSFEAATLLDLSVVRDVHDPVGLGTDQGGQLPVVATSRYSPPEYLFRLIPPGPDLWHALDIYQLGGLLHDLIMREPMFESEYQKTRDTNRYRFAWIVATEDPVIAAADVDTDLLVLARRALDKDWKRRSDLRLEDFLDEERVHQQQGLLALGANVTPALSGDTKLEVSRQLSELVVEVELQVLASLRQLNLIATHKVFAESGRNRKRIEFSWEPISGGAAFHWERVTLVVQLELDEARGRLQIRNAVSLAAAGTGQERTAQAELPDIFEVQGAATKISVSIMEVLSILAAKVLREV